MPFAIRYSPFATSRLLQRRRKILDQIIGMLEPGGEADKAFADAELGARLRRQPLMRRGRGMGDEALGVAEIVGDARDPQRVEAAERGLLAALDLEADQRRAGAHLLLHQLSLRVIGAAGIDQPRNLRVRRERVGDLARRFGLRAHAYAQCLQALEQGPGVEWRERRASMAHEVMEVLGDES